MISVDVYLFLVFSGLTCHLEDTGIGVFRLHCLPGSKETELGSSNHKASLSEGKKTGVVLVPCSCKLCSLQLFLMVWIFLRFLGVICYKR